MAHKAAMVELFWKRSPSDITKQVVKIMVDGVQQTGAEFGPDVESMTVKVKAMSSVIFNVDSIDEEGLVAASSSYDFQLGDLVAPQPATNLGHRIISIIDEDHPEDLE